MAGQSQAPDDLIAELAKLMAQDAQDTPPPKPAEPSPFTVRIPGEPANAAAQRPGEPVRIPQPPAAPAQPVPSPAAEAPPQQAAAPAAPARPQSGGAGDPFAFAFDLGARREPAATPAAAPPAVPSSPAPAPAAPPAARVQVASVAAPVVPQPAAPVTVQPAPVPEASEHDSIADLIAAELAMDSQPAPVAPRPSSPVPRPEVAPAFPVAQPAHDGQSAAPVPPAAPAPVSAAPQPAMQDRAAQAQPRPANPQPAPRPEAPRPEGDKFRIPPVFGLGTPPVTKPVEARPVDPARVEPSMAPAQPAFVRPQPVPPPAPMAPVQPAASRETIVPDDNIGLDPVDELESLIGRAVRVDGRDSDPQNEPREARPAPRSLATPQVPKPQAPVSRGTSSADETIMAAALASGAEIGWVQPPETAETLPRRKRERRQFAMPRVGFSRALAGPLVAVVLLLAAGFGLYWVLGMGGGAQDGPPPLLTADAAPVKETPPAPAEPAADQQSVVFNEMDGVVPGAEEQLVSRDQADVNEVTQVATTPEISGEGLANRKVRTVTVRPDGTIVSGDNSLAGSTILPVDRPNVPAVPGAETASPELLASTPGQAAVPPPGEGAAAPPADPLAALAAAPADTAAVPPPAAEPAAPPAPIATPGSTVPAVDAAGTPLPGKSAVIPLQRPTSFRQRPSAAAEPTSPVNAVVAPETAAATQLPPPPAGQPSAALAGATEVAALPNDAPAYVQLASQRTEAEARTTAQGLVSRFGPLFNGANMEVQRVDLGARGIFYRVRVPANSVQEASSMCNNIKAAGGDCFAM